MKNSILSIEQAVTNRIMLPDLKKILDDAPIEVLYTEDDNGFDLENEVLKINYVVRDFDLDNVINLWYIKTWPIVVIKGSYMQDKEGSKPTLYCWDIALIDQHDGFKSAHIQKGETLPFIPVGREEWFKIAEELIIKAESKYGLLDRVKRYWTGKGKDPTFDLLPKSQGDKTQITYQPE
jgi:hypothetical protein